MGEKTTVQELAKAMTKVAKILEGLDPDARKRVLEAVAAQFGTAAN